MLMTLALLLTACGGSSPPVGPNPAPPPTLLIIGDSHAEAWKASAPGYTVRNAGIGGQTSSQVEARFEPNCTNVVLVAGTNDVWLIKGATPTAIERMATKARQAGCVPVLFLIPRILRADDPPGTADVRAWNTEIAAIANRLGLSTIDGYSISLQDGALQADGVHFTAEGYRQLNAKLVSLL